jgi:tetratricopeptide (TPR) repeat protein
MQWDWGNSGDPKIYHDVETRKNGITYRSNLARLADVLIKKGDFEKAEQLFDLGMEKMPVDKFEYYSLLEPFIAGYYQIGKPEKARKVYKDVTKKYQENIFYYSGLKPSKQRQYAQEIISAIEYYRGLVEVSIIFDVEEFAKDYLSGIDCNYISSKMIKVDRYPAIEVIYDLVIQVLDESYERRNVTWIIFYEDALVSLMGSSSKKDFRDNYYIFFKITNSVLFEDQYNSINNNYVGDNENFEIYVDKFYRELESAGIYKIRPEKVNIKLRPLDSFKDLNHLHGYSLGYNNIFECFFMNMLIFNILVYSKLTI